MEAHKERREQLVEKEDQKQHTNDNEKKATCKESEGILDPLAKSFIKHSIISNEPDEEAQNSDDLLVFSRSLHNTDSSLE